MWPHSFIVTELAPLLIHVQSDDVAANIDTFSSVNVGTAQSCWIHSCCIVSSSRTKTSRNPGVKVNIFNNTNKSLFSIIATFITNINESRNDHRLRRAFK